MLSSVVTIEKKRKERLSWPGCFHAITEVYWLETRVTRLLDKEYVSLSSIQIADVSFSISVLSQEEKRKKPG